MAALAQPAVAFAEGVMRRRPGVSANAVRERRELDPGTCCPDCGGDLRLVGEDVSEILDSEPLSAIDGVDGSCSRRRDAP